MAVLDSNTRLVTLQFSFSNADAIPDSVRCKGLEMSWEQGNRTIRNNSSSGVMTIEPMMGCSLERFIHDLEAMRYQLVDAFYQPRIDPKDPNQQRVYHVVRFVYAHPDFVVLSDEFQDVQVAVRNDLLIMCEDAFWRVRAFLNPFYHRLGQEIAGQHVQSICLEARQPRVLPNGQPVTARLKDEQGRRTGDPVPIKPSFFLGIDSGGVVGLTAA